MTSVISIQTLYLRKRDLMLLDAINCPISRFLIISASICFRSTAPAGREKPLVDYRQARLRTRHPLQDVGEPQPMPEKIFVLVAGNPFFHRLFELKLEPQILANSFIHLPKVGQARISASCATSTVAAPLASSCPSSSAVRRLGA